MARLKDKVAVITGATSGMALATARLFVEKGAYVLITGDGDQGRPRTSRSRRSSSPPYTGYLPVLVKA
jgi:NAD(P)-dependent dehydrogenase (short-subunit alcohol dehydrogenase family)